MKSIAEPFGLLVTAVFLYALRWTVAGLAFVVGLSLMQLGSLWSILSVLSLPLYFSLLGAFGVEADDREHLERLRHKVPFLRRPPQLRAAS